MTRSTWYTFTLLAVLVGCSGDKLLGPPDAPACTVGGIVAGQAVTGTLSPSSCPVFSEWEYWPEHYESWTMPVQAGHAYFLHLAPDTAAAGDSLDADLLLYARNAGNDPVLSAASTDYDATARNVVGMRGQDLLFVAPENAVVSIRVETSVTDSTVLGLGAYRLTATECASTPITANDSATASVSFGASTCVVRETSDSVKYVFYPFTGVVGHSYLASTIIDSGAAIVAANIAGPAYDLQCEVRFDCDWAGAASADSSALTYVPATSGQYAAFALIADDGSAGAFHLRLTDLGLAPVAPEPVAHVRGRIAR